MRRKSISQHSASKFLGKTQDDRHTQGYRPKALPRGRGASDRRILSVLSAIVAMSSTIVSTECPQ